MKAAVLRRYGESPSSDAVVRYDDVPAPTIQSPTGVIVRVLHHGKVQGRAVLIP